MKYEAREQRGFERHVSLLQVTGNGRQVTALSGALRAAFL